MQTAGHEDATNDHSDGSRAALLLTSAACAVYFASSLYFLAATASLHDDYQPGIETLQAWAQPGMALAVTTLLAGLTRSQFTVRLAITNSACATLICLAMFILVSLHPGHNGTWRFPQDRTLRNTVQIALFMPSFSGRSTGRVVASGVVAVMWLGVSLVIGARRKRS